MMRRSLAVAIFILGASLAGTSMLPSASASTLYVGGAGPSNYTTIQGAIDAASPGDTIYVFNGTYQENIVVSKALSLIGENSATTTIDADAVSDAINITANWVNITGFEVANGDHSQTSTGIRLHSVRDCLIANNNIHWTEEGVILQYSTGNRIMSNTFFDTLYGIWLVSSDDNQISDNQISSWWDGIALTQSDGNEISDNRISSGFDGIDLDRSGKNILLRNSVRNAWDGIVIGSSHFNTVINNNASNNVRYGIYLVGSRSNTVYHNNLVGNRNSPGREEYGDDNVRDNGYPSGGNYYGPCEDVMWGYDQDHPGSDSVCDCPMGWGFDYDDPNQVIWLTDMYPLAYPIQTPESPPSPPRTLTAKARPWSVTLRWDPPSFDGFSAIANYSVHRRSESSPEALLAEIGNVLTYTDTEVDVGRTYYYIVSAKNAAGEGPKSSEVMVTVPVSWRPPLDLIRVPGFENNTVNWTPPGGGGGSRICSSTGHEEDVREAGPSSILRRSRFESRVSGTGFIRAVEYLPEWRIT